MVFVCVGCAANASLTGLQKLLLQQQWCCQQHGLLLLGIVRAHCAGAGHNPVDR
jgi:hypothetical protein